MLVKFPQGGVPRKKVLALVLTLALALSVAAGAAFTDQKQIKNTEAVDACVALNIIGGYPDGSYKPEGNITRAEFTKMLCVLLNGGKEPTLGTAVKPTFSDVSTSANAAWAEKYIESCVAQGIVSGVGGGKFAPNSNVTGSQAAKMLLVALGYKSDIETFTGAAWEVNVNVVATKQGLYKGLEGVDTSKPLTRDAAAKMVWNALQAKEVKYDYTLVSENGQLVSKTTLVDKVITLLEDKYDAVITKGIVTSIGHNSKGYLATIDTLTTDSNKKAITVDLSKVAKDPTDLVGKAVKAIYKDTDDVYGIYVDDENTATVVTTTLGDIDLSKDEYKLDGVTYKTNKTKAADFGAVAAVDALGNDFNKAAAGSTTTPANDLDAVPNTISKASQVVLIDNTGDEKIDVAVVTPVQFGKLTYLGSSKLTVNGGVLSNVDKDDCDLYAGAAKDDFVAVIAKDYVADNTNVITKLDKVTGKVEAKKGTDEYRIDGTWYTSLITSAYTPGTTEGDYYIYNGYIVKDDAKSGSIADTAFVIKVGSAFDVDGNYQVKVMINGETKVVSAEVNTQDSTILTSTEDAYCTYEIDDGVYQFKPITDTNSAPSDFTYGTVAAYKDKKLYETYTSTSATGTVSGTSYILDSDAVVYVKYKTDKYAILTGKDVAGWGDKVKTLSGVVLTKTEDGLTVVKGAYLNLGDNAVPASTATYGVITSDIVSAKDNKREFTIWNGTDYVDVVTKSTASLNTFDLVEYQANNDGTYDITLKAAATAKQAIIGYSKTSGDIKFADANGSSNVDTKMVTKDTLVLFVNTDKDVDAKAAGILGEEIAVSDKPVSNYNTNAIWYDDDTTDTDLTVLVIDTVNTEYAAG